MSRALADGSINQEVGVNHEHSVFLHRLIQRFTVGNVHPRSASVEGGEGRKQGSSLALGKTSAEEFRDELRERFAVFHRSTFQVTKERVGDDQGCLHMENLIPRTEKCQAQWQGVSVRGESRQ